MFQQSNHFSEYRTGRIPSVTTMKGRVQLWQEEIHIFLPFGIKSNPEEFEAVLKTCDLKQ